MGDFDLFALTAQPRFLVFLFVQAVVAFACFAAIIGLRFLRRGAARFWIGPALVATSVLPGVVATLFTAFAFRDVLAGVALTGSRGTGALAAGSMESLLPLVVGLVCVGGLSLLALVVVAAGTSRVDEQAAPGGTTFGTLAAPFAVVLGFVPLLAATAFVNRVNFGGVEPARVLLWWRLVAFCAVAVGVALTAFAVATVVRAPRSRAPLLAKVLPPLSLLAVALGSAVTCVPLFGSMSRLSDLATPDPRTIAIEAPDSEEPQGAVPPEPAAGQSPASGPGETTTIDEPAAPSAPRPTTRPRPSPVAPRATRVDPGAVRVGGTIKEPRKLKNVAPVYPEMAKRSRVQGIVILECTIGPDGRVQDVKVLRGVQLLDDAAVDAVRQWVYTPTLLNGVPVPVIMTVTVNFKLS